MALDPKDTSPSEPSDGDGSEGARDRYDELIGDAVQDCAG